MLQKAGKFLQTFSCSLQAKVNTQLRTKQLHMKGVLPRQLFRLSTTVNANTFKTAASIPQTSEVVGSYTSHTKKLWVARITREKKADANSPLQQPRNRAPVTTTVNYPFSTDPVLKEEASLNKYTYTLCAEAMLQIIRYLK